MSQASRGISTSCASAIRPAARVLAVTSVDGVNVITGETAAQEQSGYVLDALGLACASKAGARASTRSRRSTSRDSPIRTPRAPAGRTTSA